MANSSSQINLIHMVNGLQLINIGCHSNTRIEFGPLTAIVGQNGTGKTTVLSSLESIVKSWHLADDTGESRLELDGKLVKNGNERRAFIAASFFREPFDDSDPRIKGVWCSGCVEVKSVEDIQKARFNSTLNDLIWLIRYCDAGTPLDTPDFSKIKWEEMPALTVTGDDSNSHYLRRIRTLDGAHAEDDITRLLDLGLFKTQYPMFEIQNYSGCTYLKVNLAKLRLSSYSPETEPRLSADGSKLATVLANLMASERSSFEKILTTLREVVPSVKDIRAKRCPIVLSEPVIANVKGREVVYTDEREVQGHQLRFDTETGTDLPASSISDGTLYVLALSTLIHTAGKSSLILLDDIEQGLHPSAQRQLVRQIKRLQELHACQIVLTTHSPYVIDELEADQVWLLSHSKEESVTARKLSDHPRAAEALKVLTTGEFWTSEGENWL